MTDSSSIVLPVRDYDLTATLDSGQVFRWRQIENSWIGVVGKNCVRLTQSKNGILAETAAPVDDWNWLREFLQTETDLAAILKTFSDDEPMRKAVAACCGLRLLRQDPWECLASFILSSTKQIVQIRQIVSNLCECFGQPIDVRNGEASWGAGFACFPTAEKIASLTEKQLRDCKMGFRAPNLLAAARQIAEGKLDLESLRHLSTPKRKLN